MNEKIGIQDLVVLLAEKADITKKDAEAFVKECFDIMEEGLVTDKLLKIKNLGTFKLIRVEDRESVNVSTGERLLIPAHYKVTFSPDIELAEKINVPYASLETIEMENETLIDDEMDDETTDGDDDDDDDEIEEKFSEPLYLLTETENQKEPEIKEDEIIPEEPEVVENEPEEPEVVENEFEEQEIEEIIEELEIIEPEQEEPEQISTTNEDLEFEPETPVYSEPDKEYYQPKKKQRSTLLWISLIIVFGIISFFAGSYFCPGISFWERKTAPDSVAVFSYSVNKPQADDSIHTKTDSATLQTVETPKPQTSVNQEYKVRNGERLNTIALREYGHKAFWVYIYEENRKKIGNPDLIEPGMTIQIPPAEKYGIDKNNPESVNKALSLQQKYKQ